MASKSRQFTAILQFKYERELKKRTENSAFCVFIFPRLKKDQRHLLLWRSPVSFISCKKAQWASKNEICRYVIIADQVVLATI